MSMTRVLAHPRSRRRTASRPVAHAFSSAISVHWLGGTPFGGETHARRSNEPSQALAARPRRVLLVDDDAALRMLYRFNLEASGVEVVEVEDGEAALQALQGELPDVLLLDVMMPGVDGWTVAARLAADPRTRELPVIFITARADDAARRRGLGLGAVGYLAKPFNPAKLAEEIEKILGDGSAQDRPVP